MVLTGKIQHPKWFWGTSHHYILVHCWNLQNDFLTFVTFWKYCWYFDSHAQSLLTWANPRAERRVGLQNLPWRCTRSGLDTAPWHVLWSRLTRWTRAFLYCFTVHHPELLRLLAGTGGPELKDTFFEVPSSILDERFCHNFSGRVSFPTNVNTVIVACLQDPYAWNSKRILYVVHPAIMLSVRAVTFGMESAFRFLTQSGACLPCGILNIARLRGASSRALPAALSSGCLDSKHALWFPYKSKNCPFRIFFYNLQN